MLEQILNVNGIRIITKKEQNTFKGGMCRACVTIPGSGPMSPEQKKACEACQDKNSFTA